MNMFCLKFLQSLRTTWPTDDHLRWERHCATSIHETMQTNTYSENIDFLKLIVLWIENNMHLRCNLYLTFILMVVIEGSSVAGIRNLGEDRS
jgi:hypothetical protein